MILRQPCLYESTQAQFRRHVWLGLGRHQCSEEDATVQGVVRSSVSSDTRLAACSWGDRPVIFAYSY